MSEVIPGQMMSPENDVTASHTTIVRSEPVSTEKIQLHSESTTSAEDNVQQPATSRDIHGLQWVLALIATLSSTLLFGLDTTITADIQPAVVADFQSIDRMTWISVAFLLSASSTNFF